ncbi:MAG TPA: MarR family transcriptional regulator [Noviherbaspirillum sp.]|nr:MarR family transcriptional regulator [Noviherbaspirillum sp.]
MTQPISSSPEFQKPASVQEQFGLAIGEIGRSWRHKLDQRLKPLGLSQSKWRTLLYVSRASDGLTQTDLAHMLGIEAPTVTRLVKQLEADGWIRRRALPDDARCKLVQLTPKAKRAMLRIDAAVARLRAETVGRLTDKQAAAGLAALQTLQRLLDDV